MALDVLAGKLLEMWRLGTSPTLRASSSAASRAEAVAQHPANHPERADPDRRGAVDEHRVIGGIVGEAQELVHRGFGEGRKLLLTGMLKVP